MEVHISELGVFINLIGCRYRHYRTIVFQWTARNCPCIGAARERHHLLHLPWEDLAARAFFFFQYSAYEKLARLAAWASFQGNLDDYFDTTFTRANRLGDSVIKSVSP